MTDTNQLQLQKTSEWIVEKTAEIPAILESHRTRAGKAITVGENIKAAVTENGGELTASIDERANNFLANCKKALKEMQDSRKPITQILDEIKAMFTQEEAKLDPAKSDLLKDIQKIRDAYARQVLEAQEKAKREAELKAQIAKKEEELAGYARTSIAKRLSDFLDQKKARITAAFNAITLENFDEKKYGLETMTTDIDLVHGFDLGKVIEYPEPTPATLHPVTEDRWRQIRGLILSLYDFAAWKAEHNQQIEDLKRQLLDRLPAHHTYLVEQKAAAEKAEAMRRAAEEAKAANDERARIEAEAAARAAERELQARQAEQAAREAEQAAEAARQAAAKQKEIEEAEAIRQAGAAAHALFNQAEQVAETEKAPEARTGYEIEVLHQSGWVEIFQFWFTREAARMTIEEIGGKKLEQMKKYAEDIAKKEDLKIDSKFLRYKTAIKAINRKTK